jgi:hypothetical protein
MHRKREEVDPLRQAAQWRIQAGILRRRAMRPEATEEQRAAAEERARWYERRAELVDEAYPGMPIFPRELRTPVDRLDLVDDLRRAALDLAELVNAIDDAEIVSFTEAVRRARGPSLPATRAIEMANLARYASLDLAVSLGASGGDHLEDYAIEIVEGDNLDNAPEVEA